MEIEAIPTGDSRFEDESFLAALYALYRNVYDQSEIHFDLLTAAFFRAVLRDADVHGIVFLYRAGGMLIGFNLCVCENATLIDKYVGFRYPEAREHDLYTVSWFHNLEYALEHGFRKYIAGWTDPEIKRHLGAHDVEVHRSDRRGSLVLRRGRHVVALRGQRLAAPVQRLRTHRRRWVASAQPGGKPLTGAAVNEFVDQFVDSRNNVCPLSTLRNCTTG